MKTKKSKKKVWLVCGVDEYGKLQATAEFTKKSAITLAAVIEKIQWWSHVTIKKIKI